MLLFLILAITYTYGKHIKEPNLSSDLSFTPPSRPPAPRLSSSDCFSITVSICLDPNDDSPRRRRKKNIELNHYEVQYENQTASFNYLGNSTNTIVDRSGEWFDLGFSAIPYNYTKLTSVTLKGIEPNTAYRYVLCHQNLKLKLTY